MDNCSNIDMDSMRVDVWGDPNCFDAPTTMMRRRLIMAILRSAHRASTGAFEFYAGQKEKNNRLICEPAFLVLLGLSNNASASKAPSQWLRCKQYILQGLDVNGVDYSMSLFEEKELKGEKKRQKFNSAVTFINYFAREFGDRIHNCSGKGVCSVLFMLLLDLMIRFAPYDRWSRCVRGALC